MRSRRILVAVVVAAFVGISVFLVMAWNATTVVEVPAVTASARFAEVRAAFGNAAPLLTRHSDGSVTRHPDAPAPQSAELGHLYVLAYQAESERLVEVDIPFWFFALKAPAAQFMVRGTGFDLNELGVDPADLEVQGPGVVLDEATGGGSRLMVWTE